MASILRKYVAHYLGAKHTYLAPAFDMIAAEAEAAEAPWIPLVSGYLTDVLGEQSVTYIPPLCSCLAQHS